MGVFSLFKKRSLNEKVIDKIYNKIFVKEYIVSDLKINENYIESLLICSYGVYLIKIIATKNIVEFKDNNYCFDDQIINVFDIDNKLDSSIDLLKNIIGKEIEINKEIIIKCHNDECFKNNSIDNFIYKLEKLEKTVSNEKIEEKKKKLIQYRTYK